VPIDSNGEAGDVPPKQLLTHRASRTAPRTIRMMCTRATEPPATSRALAHDLNMLVSAVKA